MRGDVDVVVVAYRSSRTLRDCLASLATGHRVQRVVVVDNASPDDSAAIARREGVDVVSLDANLGFGAGCNAGVAATTAPYVLLLNPDALVLPGTIDGLAAVLDRMPRVAAVASEVIGPSGPEPVRRRFPSVLRAPLEPGLAGRLDERAYRRRHPEGGPADWLSAVSLLVRRTAFDEVGGFDTRYFLYSEEVDLCARLAAAGWERWWEPALPTRHVGAVSTSALAGEGKVAWVDGYLRVARDHHRHPGALRLAIALGLAGRAAVWGLAARPAASRKWRAALRRCLVP